MKFLERLAPLFRFTPNEKRGLSVLLLLILIVLCIRIAAPTIRSRIGALNNNPFKVSTLVFESAKSLEDKSDSFNTEKIISVPILDTNLIIDPNDCTFDDLISIGFSEFAASNLIKYRKGGGVFYSSGDIAKIYGVEKTFIAQINRQIKIRTKPIDKTVSVKPQLLLELNSVDSVQIQKIPFVGPVRGKRIIKYRETLGGFYTIDQLKNVYGIDSLCFSKIKSSAWVDSSNITRIHLNKCDEQELSQHPNISTYQARAIVKYRELMSDFEDIRELRSNFIFTEDEFKKVENYLTLSQ